MRWHLLWGGKVAYFAKRGRKCPEKVPPKPVLRQDLLFYWNAFWELSADRPPGMGVGRIPFASIDAFARRYRITSLDAFDRLRTLIRLMDEAFRDVASGNRAMPDPDGSGIKGLLARLSKQHEKPETQGGGRHGEQR